MSALSDETLKSSTKLLAACTLLCAYHLLDASPDAILGLTIGRPVLAEWLIFLITVYYVFPHLKNYRQHKDIWEQTWKDYLSRSDQWIPYVLALKGIDQLDYSGYQLRKANKDQRQRHWTFRLFAEHQISCSFTSPNNRLTPEKRDEINLPIPVGFTGERLVHIAKLKASFYEEIFRILFTPFILFWIGLVLHFCAWAPIVFEFLFCAWAPIVFEFLSRNWA